MPMPHPSTGFSHAHTAVICIIVMATAVMLSFTAVRAAAPGDHTSTLPLMHQTSLADDGDDLGLDIGLFHSDGEALLTIFYDATSYGEVHPCPT